MTRLIFLNHLIQIAINLQWVKIKCFTQRIAYVKDVCRIVGFQVARMQEKTAETIMLLFIVTEKQSCGNNFILMINLFIVKMLEEFCKLWECLHSMKGSENLLLKSSESLKYVLLYFHNIYGLILVRNFRKIKEEYVSLNLLHQLRRQRLELGMFSLMWRKIFLIIK